MRTSPQPRGDLVRLPRAGAPPLVKLAVALLIVAAALLDRAGLFLARAPDDLARYDGTTATVTAVIDGDTIDLDRSDPRGDLPATRVRVWGMDAPPRDTAPLGAEAASRVRSLVMGRRVTLALEPHRTRERYGRLLAHVFLPDGTSLAERLLEEGLARADDRWPHARLDDHARAEGRARRREVGLWARPPAPPDGAP
jgi:micrococcal nuclease